MLKMKERLLCFRHKATALAGKAAPLYRKIAALLRKAAERIKPLAIRAAAKAGAGVRQAASYAARGAAKIKPQAVKAGRFVLRHRIPAAVISCCLVMTMLMSVITVSIQRVDIMEDGVKIDSFYAILTDEASILEKAGLTLSEGDELTKSENGGVVTVQIARAFPVSIHADGETVLVMLTGGTVADALAKAGLSWGAEDLLNPGQTEALTEGMEITLDRVTNDQVIETVSIDYETVKKETDTLYVGQTKVEQAGEKGEKRLTYSVTYLNGEESDRELISTEITKEPVDQIVLVGTKVRSSFKKTSSTPTTYKKVIAMTATAYTAGGTTATGVPARWGVVAVDPKVIPLGTKVYVETADGKYIYGTAVAADTGGAIKGNKIDICVNTNAEANAFGRRTVNVYIL